MFIEKEVQNLRWYPQRNSTICSHAFTFVNEFDICYFRITISTVIKNYFRINIMKERESVSYLGNFETLEKAKLVAENYYEHTIKK